MRRITAILAAVSAVAFVAVGRASAKVVTSADDIKGNNTVINFSELKSKDKKTFGSPEVGQPYAPLGLVLPSQMIDASANLAPDQQVAIRSTGISTVDNSNYQSVAFTKPQKLVAFTVRSEKATSITVTALDKNGNVLDEAVLPASTQAQFVGFRFDEAKITVVRVVAPHATMADAIASPTMVSGIAFNAMAEDLAAGGPGAGTSDLGYASAAIVIGGGPAGNALAFAGGGGGFGAGGGGGASNQGAGRNPGNRNPNLPPAVIPEPTTVLGAGLAALVMVGGRRRSV